MPKFKLKNVADTFQSLLSNTATAIREWTFPDKDGTIAMISDITKSQVGLGSVDNTTDLAKPISTLTQAALDLKQNAILTSVSVTGAITLDGTAFGKMHICSGTAADYTIGLPTAVGNSGKTIGFKAANALTKIVTIDGNGSETLNGLLIRAIGGGGSFVLLSDGANWDVVNEIGSMIPFTPTATGVTALGSSTCFYILSGRTLFLSYFIGNSVSNATTFTLSLPGGFTCGTGNFEALTQTVNNSTFPTTPGIGQISATGTAISLFLTTGGGAWTASNNKAATFQITIQVT
jgi:hypothetical protein